MKTKPTWTRYGRGVIMMGNHPPAKTKPGEPEQQISPQPNSKPLDHQKG